MNRAAMTVAKRLLTKCDLSSVAFSVRHVAQRRYIEEDERARDAVFLQWAANAAGGVKSRTRNEYAERAQHLCEAIRDHVLRPGGETKAALRMEFGRAVHVLELN